MKTGTYIIICLLIARVHSLIDFCAGGGGRSAFFNNGNEGSYSNDMALYSSEFSLFSNVTFTIEFWIKLNNLAIYPGFPIFFFLFSNTSLKK